VVVPDAEELIGVLIFQMNGSCLLMFNGSVMNWDDRVCDSSMGLSNTSPTGGRCHEVASSH